MNPLERLGFRKSWVYETIVATRSESGVNAAPMGVWSADLDSLSLRIHRTSKTLENIKRNRRFSVNFPEDIELFFDAVFDREKLRTEGGSLFLDGCVASLEAEAATVEEKDDAAQVTARILSYSIKKKPRLINRAEYLALDSLIAYTKLSSVSDEERDMLTERIRENLRVIRRTAPDSDFLRLGERLLD